MSLTVEGKVCINNEINHFVSCINIVTIAEPIDTIISRQHSVKHEILKVGQVLSGKEVCFVHDGIIARIGGNLNPSCATLPTGSATSPFFTIKTQSLIELSDSNYLTSCCKIVGLNIIVSNINLTHDCCSCNQKFKH